MASGSPSPPKWVAQQPSAFDIVATYFPESQPKGELELRPCLVLDVLRNKRTGAVACRVAYGTKNKHLDDDDNLYVISLRRPYYGRGPQDVNDWLERRLVW